MDGFCPARSGSGLMIWGALGSGLNVAEPYKLLPVSVPPGWVISATVTMTLAVGLVDCTKMERAMLEKEGMLTSRVVSNAPPCWNEALYSGSRLPVASAG